MELYHKTSYEISNLITSRYSTSFSLGIKAFRKDLREAIYAVYGYVRVADEIVDTFHGFKKKELLDEFRAETYRALERGISTNPVIHAFQRTVKEYNIDREFIDDFLNSMEMDLYNTSYKKTHYDNYVHGSAEVVGLMCLRVFCKGNTEQYNQLLEPAKKLGSAFQKVNFLRDIKNDIEERSRIYLPDVGEVEGINNDNKKKLEHEIFNDFKQALEGIKRLPKGVKLGVYSAYLYYLLLFKKIVKNDVHTLLNKRVRISNLTKLALLFKSVIQVKITKSVDA